MSYLVAKRPRLARSHTSYGGVDCVPARNEGHRTYQMSEQHTLNKFPPGIETCSASGYRLPGRRRPMTQYRAQRTGSSKVDKEGSCV
jgi:hypothetical protein